MSDPTPAQIPPDPDGLQVGDLVRLEVGPVAHGGHCVARADGRVVFVRHALPGEVVLARITEAKPGSFCRADAVEIRQASADRVVPPCVHFAPGGCGGCDFQHAALPAQRRMKAAVVAEQLLRLGGEDRKVEVEALPGGGFGWRTRLRWAVAADGVVGPRVHRSSDVVPVTVDAPCLIASPGLTEAAMGTAEAADTEIALAATEDGRWLAVPQPGPAAPTVTETVRGRPFSVAADGFWQVHAAAAETLVDAVIGFIPDDVVGATAWDLYSGVGLFAAFLAEKVGRSGSVYAVESDRAAADLAGRNLADLRQVTVRQGRVDRVLRNLPRRVDVVVLDPPRSGAGRAICAAIAERGPRAIIYVACDPAALGRDTAVLREAGYRLSDLRAFDAFPQTHHVECVALFVPAN